MSKACYKIRNWSQYNRSLINRGNIALWIPADSEVQWYSIKKSGKKGREEKYSDTCIELILTIKNLFRLPLRGVQGFFIGLFDMLNLSLEIPDYTRLSRRGSELGIKMKKNRQKGEKIDIVLDSTGLKIYGEGEWKTKIHGKDKRRTWRKLHIGIDPKTGEVVATEVTKANTADNRAATELLKEIEDIENVYGDGAYMFKNVMDVIAEKNATPVVAIRTGTCPVDDDPSPGEKLRNKLVEEMKLAGGRELWKKASGYHLRSLVETHMYRHKTILGDKLYSRKFENQKMEGVIKCLILNKMTSMGMPDSYKI